MKKNKMKMAIGVLFICIGINQSTIFALNEKKITNPYKKLNVKFDEAYDNKVKNQLINNDKVSDRKLANINNYDTGDSYETKMKLKKIDEDKSKLAAEYSKKINSLGTQALGGRKAYGSSSKVNKVGTYDQWTGYYCGPATLMNVVAGYDIANYGRYSTYVVSSPYGDVRLRNQADYAAELGTKSGSWYEFGAIGTNLSSKWIMALNKYCPDNNYTIKYGEALEWDVKVRNAVLWTISKDNGYEHKNYNVVINMNKGVTSNSIGNYYNHAAAHYYTVYGYENNGYTMWISDSNTRAGVPNTYKANQYLVARDCQSRGIIW